MSGCTRPKLHLRGLVCLGAGEGGSSELVGRNGSGSIAVDFSFHGIAKQDRECVVSYARGVAPVGVRSQRERPSRTQGMHYTERDGAFAQQLGTVGAEIRQALPRSLTAVYAKKGWHR